LSYTAEDYSPPVVIAIDPKGCGCTECLVGEYVPLQRASKQQIAAMLRGDLYNHTSATFDITVAYTVEGFENSLVGALPHEVTVSSRYDDLSWTIDPADFATGPTPPPAPPRHHTLPQAHRQLRA